jgi:HPt (histidine-containing phosphotransfer) domain-containing protein
LSKLVTLFLNHYPKMLAELREAVKQRDGEWLARAAHSLRGGSGSFLNGPAKAGLESLEAMGKTGEISQSADTLTQVETEMSHLDRVLATFVRETGI